MYGGYNITGSPPLPDILGPYYSTGYGSGGISGLGVGGINHQPLSAYTGDIYGTGATTTTTGGAYLYDPLSTSGIYGSMSPIRRRRYSIAGLPSATMMNDYYNMYPSTSAAAAAAFGLQTGIPLQHASSSNLVNLLNETHKSISRSSQILNQHARLQQAQPITPLQQHYPGRIISSYPTLHPGGEISPPYLSDNLLQMSNSFSSQPNMYFQQYTQPTHAQTIASNLQRSTLRPAYSVSNLNLNAPTAATTTSYTPYNRYFTGGVGGIGSTYNNSSLNNTHPYSQSLLNHSDLPYILQQRQLLSSLHASNPAISQYYQQQLPTYLQHYAQQPQQQQHNPLQYNLQQQFAGSHHYAHQLGGLSNMHHPSAHIHQSVQQQLNPNHQYHVHAHQNHLQTHPLAALANTNSPFGGQLASSNLGDTRTTTSGITTYDNLHTNAYHQQQQQQQQPPLSTQQQPPPTHHHHHPHIHHPTAPHTHHPTTTTPHHHHHTTPYSKLDLDYPKLPQEHKRQVSFKFDVDQLSLDS